VIAARLGVTDKTVAKGIRWLRAIGRRGERSEPGS
jgi:biotin operon repressor